jgi:hypothetical protein
MAARRLVTRRKCSFAAVLARLLSIRKCSSSATTNCSSGGHDRKHEPKVTMSDNPAPSHTKENFNALLDPADV